MAKNIGILQDKDNNTVYPIGFETITNSNGTALKFPDGTMICYGERTITATNSNKVGSLYYAGSFSLGNYPVKFVERPICTLQIKGDMSVVEYDYGDASYMGSCYIMNATSRTNKTERIGFIAIGRWK